MTFTVSKSYPGVESDAVSALRVLDKLITAREASGDGTVALSSSNEYLSQTELAVYRLKILGLVDDYVITYRPNPHFHVGLLLPESSRLPNAMTGVQASRIEEYELLENFAAKTQKFVNFVRYEALFNSVYQHLLLQLDHTYKDVVKMRYDILWNLQELVNIPQCRRIAILAPFGENLKPENRCGCCDICSPSLDFLSIRSAPQINATIEEKQIELEKAFSGKLFDLAAMIGLRDDFRDYPTAKYAEARSVLEGDANNLPALFFTREFSPPNAYAANNKRLLRTANQKPLSLPVIAELFSSSAGSKADLLPVLNESDTACDTDAGRRFLMQEAAKPENRQNLQVVAMHECLDFMLWVEDDLPGVTETLKRKARELENAFSYA